MTICSGEQFSSLKEPSPHGRHLSGLLQGSGIRWGCTSHRYRSSFCRRGPLFSLPVPVPVAVREERQVLYQADTGMEERPPQRQALWDQPMRLCEPKKLQATFPCLLSPAIGTLLRRLIIASPTARKEIFLCNKNSFGVFYSLLIHAKQESMTHCLLWL